MAFDKPADVRNTFADPKIASRKRIRPKAQKNPRMRSHKWPNKQLNYETLEACKEVVVRVRHPNTYYKHKNTEIRVSIMRWSRASYLDIRMYKNGISCGAGVLLHVDIASAILPDIVSAIRKMEMEDSREPEQKNKIEVIQA